MELQLKIEEVFNEILKKKQIYQSEISTKCSNGCLTKTKTYIPIPIRKSRDQIWCKGWCCSYKCLIDFLRKQKTDGNVEYNYSLNIIWALMPFLVTNWADTF